MKRVLVICEYFAPIRSIASIRFTKILKYLAKTGDYTFDVISLKTDEPTDKILENDLKAMRGITRVKYIDTQDNILDKAWNKIKSKKENSIATGNGGDSTAIKFLPYKDVSFKGKLYKVANTVKYIYGENLFATKGIKFLEEKQEKYDCVISSYGDAGTHLLALKYVKKHPGIKWIADYRDSIMMYYRPPIFNYYFNNILEKSYTYSEYLTGVTEEAMSKFGKSKKSHVICNGFDREDLKYFKNSKLNLEQSKFNISYTGRIYAGKSDADLLFKALRELSDENKIQLDKVAINYAGTDFELISSQSEKYNLTGQLKNFGFIERADALSMQKQSQLLLVLSWSDEEGKDILTGKFLEYLMIERPILAVVKGKYINTGIYKILEESDAGYCFEEARGEKAYEDFKLFIEQQYNEFISTEIVTYTGNREVLEKFSYAYLAKQYQKLIDD